MKVCENPLDSGLKEPERSAAVMLDHLGMVVVKGIGGCIRFGLLDNLSLIES